MKKFGRFKFNKNVFKSHRDPSKLVFHHTRDWRILTISFFVLLGGIFLLHYFLYIKSIDYEASVRDTTPFDDIDRVVLQELIDSFENKERILDNIVNNRKEIIDPSL